MRPASVGLLALSLSLAALAAAQPTPLSGTIYLEDALLVGPNETLVIAPGTTITGPGRIEVDGALRVEGAPSDRVELAVPVVLRGNGSSLLQDARLWGVPGVALRVEAGNVSLLRVAFEGNGIGLGVDGASPSVTGESLLFRAHAAQGARIVGPSDVRLARAAFQDNQRGLLVDWTAGGGRVVVNDSTFERNDQHVLFDLGESRAVADALLARNDVGPVNAAEARLASIEIRSILPQEAPMRRQIALDSNRNHGGDVGLRVEGGGVHVVSTNDSFDADRVGVSVTRASVALVGARLDSIERDVEDDGESALVLVDVVRARDTVPAAATRPAPIQAWWAAPVAIVVVAAAVASTLALRARRGARSAPEAAALPAPALPAAPPPDLGAPLKPLEARILRDVATNPGSAQSAIAQRLGLSRQALHYHVKKLEARGLLTKVPQGRETRCFVPAAVVAALPAEAELPLPVTDPQAVEKR